jgi:hypothetical protein
MKLWVEEGARAILTGTDTTEAQLVFQANGPPTCADGATRYEEVRGCQESTEVASGSSSNINGIGIGYNSDVREVCRVRRQAFTAAITDRVLL